VGRPTLGFVCEIYFFLSFPSSSLVSFFLSLYFFCLDASPGDSKELHILILPSFTFIITISFFVLSRWPFFICSFGGGTLALCRAVDMNYISPLTHHLGLNVFDEVSIRVHRNAVIAGWDSPWNGMGWD